MNPVLAIPAGSCLVGIALGVIPSSGADAQGSVARRKLTAPTVLDGITCAPTGRAYASFHASGRLRECPLAADTVLFGQALPARTWVELTDDGRLRHAWLPRNASLSGHVCRGSGYREWSVLFHPSGALALCYLAREELIDGVPCQRGTFWIELRGRGKSEVRFRENGRLQSCQAARSFELNGRKVKKWEVVRLSEPP